MSTLYAAFPGTMLNEADRHIVMAVGSHSWSVVPGEPDAKFVNVDGDKGGPTKWGVSQAATLLNTGRLWTPEEIAALTLDQVFAYALRFYWPMLYNMIQVQDVASKLFDVGFHAGPGTAARLCQQAAVSLGSGIDVDGGFGPKTLAAVNLCDPSALLERMCIAQDARYEAEVARDPTQAKFLEDWKKRAQYLNPRRPPT